MMKMKESGKIFLRSLYMSLVVILCIFIGFFGISKSYEAIRQIGFGEHRRAVEIKEEEILFFDFSFYL